MIGIIGAMDVEVKNLKEKVVNPTITKVAGCQFVCGLLENVMVCIVQCSPGKVNAALCTQIMIDRFKPEKIINIGVGCSLCDEVIIKNVVIASDVCQYDIDITALDEPRGFINGLNTIKIACNREMSDILARCAINHGEKIHRGTIASGDTFIGNTELKEYIHNEFDAICGEMEGGAIGHVCKANNIPFAVIRSISDGGDEASYMDYPTFKKIAAETSTAIMLAYLKQECDQFTIEL